MVQTNEALLGRNLQGTDSFRAVPVTPGVKEPITPFPTIHPVEASPVEQQEITVYEKDKVVLLPEGYRRVPGNYTWEAFSHLVLAAGPVSDNELYDNLQDLKGNEHLPGTPSVEKTMRFLRRTLEDEHGALLQRVIIDGAPGYHLNAKVSFAEPNTTPPLPTNDIVGTKIPTSYDIFLAGKQQQTVPEEKPLPSPQGRPETQKERDARLAENLWPDLAAHHRGDESAANDQQARSPRDTAETPPHQASESEPSWKKEFLAAIAEAELSPTERRAVEVFVDILVEKNKTDFVGTPEWETAFFGNKPFSKGYINVLKSNINSKIRSTQWQITNFAKGKLPAQFRLVKETAPTE